MAATHTDRPEPPSTEHLLWGDSGFVGRVMMSSTALAAEGIEVLKGTGRELIDGVDAVGNASFEAFEQWTPALLQPAVSPATKVARTVQDRFAGGARSLLAAV
jgi:hypothetical protein